MIDRQDESRSMLRDMFESALKIYGSHQENKGDSWRDVSLEQMVLKLREEYVEVHNITVPILARTFTDEDLTHLHREVLDLVNVCLMVASRTKRYAHK